MKTILLIGAMFFTTALSAHLGVPDPVCVNNEMRYMHQVHALEDFCAHELKAKSPEICSSIINRMTIEQINKLGKKFFEKRSEEICGK